MKSPVSVVDRISAAEAAAHTQQGRAVVVDARPQVARHQGSLPGAVVVEPDNLSAALAPGSPYRMVGSLDTEIAVVSVQARARLVAEQIASLGYTNVRYVDGGFSAFRSALGAR